MAAPLALAFDILARDKATVEFEKVSKSSKRTGDEVSKSSEKSADRVKKSHDKIRDSSDKTGKKGIDFGDSMKAGMATAVGAVVAGAAAMTAALMNAMDTESAKDKMVAGLSLTAGESKKAGTVAGRLYADAYGQSMSDVTGALSAVMSSIAGASALPEAELEKLTGNAMDFAAIFDVDVSRAAQVAGQAVKTGLAKNATEAFDLLTAASQKVPAALREDILDAADEYGPFFAQLGIGGEEAFAALVVGADKGMYGIDKTGDALKEFTIRATDMSKVSVGAFDTIGLDAQKMSDAILAGGDTASGAMQQIVDGLLAIESPSARANTAIALFGTPLEDLGTDGIPKFLEALSKGNDGLGDIEGATSRAGDTLNDNLSTRMTAVMRIIETKLQPTMEGLIDFVGTKVLPGIDKLSEAWESGEGPMGDIRDLFGEISTVAQERVFPALKKVAEYVRTNVAPVIEAFGKRVVGPLFENVIIPAFEDLAWVLQNVVAPILAWLWEKVWAPTFKNIGDVVENFGDHWDTIWSGIQRAAAKPVNFVIGTIWNDGLRQVFNLVRGVLGMDPLAAVGLVSMGARGGSWYDGGYTGDGGKFEPKGVVHGGEYVLTKDEVRKLGGPAALEARKHSWFDGFVSGGYVDPDGGGPRSLTTFGGKTFTRLFAGALAAAQRMAGATFNISQGGFRPATSYSGTSHRGDAVDIMGPITSGVLRALRANGIAAWDRTGKGNWAPHIHGVPLPGRGYAAGSALWQAQDYLKGGDGLGGRDNGPQVAGGGIGWTEIPGMLIKVARDVASLGDAWGGSLQGAFGSVLGGVKDWIAKSLGFPVGGYAGGTSWASPGLAWVGERGPELVNFRGGEQVYTANQSASAAPQQTLVRVELVDERMRGLVRAEVRQMQREGLVTA